MKEYKQKLINNCILQIRNIEIKDAQELINYAENISNESEYLKFGPGELGLSVTEEEQYITKYLSSSNKLYMIGCINDQIITTLNFSGGIRSRIKHRGEFGLSVRKQYWGLGIGSLMIDALIKWVNDNNIIKKNNLRVRTDNQRAIELYQRKGFIIEGTIQKEIFLNGKYFDLHWMGLKL